MKFQSTEAACGACSASNAMKALGVQVQEADVLRWIDKVRTKDDPRTEGIAPSLLMRSIAEGAPRKYNLSVRGMALEDPAAAQAVIRGLLLSGCSVLILVDGAEHWVSVVGMIGDNFIIVDSAMEELCVVYTPEQLLVRWEQHDATLRFEGIIISNKNKRRK